LEAGISSPRKSPPHTAQVRKGEKQPDELPIPVVVDEERESRNSSFNSLAGSNQTTTAIATTTTITTTITIITILPD